MTWRPGGARQRRARRWLRSLAGPARWRLPRHSRRAAPVVTLAPPARMYQHRPVLVAADLGELRAPVTGTVTLPVSLHWSGTPAAAAYDLSDPRQRPALYRTVLREARDPSDLGDWLNGDLLAELWPGLVLPAPVRAAWEQQHPRTLGAGPAQAGLPVTAGGALQGGSS